MSRYFLYGTRFSEFEQMMMLVPNFTPRKKGLIIMENVVAESSQNQSSYKRMLKNSFGNLHHRYLNKRLKDMLLFWGRDWFLTLNHLDGNIAWKDPAQAIAQRERLRKKQEKELHHEQRENISEDVEQEQSQEDDPAFSMSMTM